MISTCLHERTLPLRRPLGTAQGPVRMRRVQVLVLQDGEGSVGYGEAAPLPAFGGENPLACREALDEVIPQLPKHAERFLVNARPHAGLGPLERILRATPVARSCVESALLSLMACRRGISVAALLADDGPIQEAVPVNALLSGGNIDDLAEAASRMVAGGVRCLKLKVGNDPDADADRVRALRDWVGDRVAIRVDANAAWTLDQAKRFALATADCRLEFLEQPVAADDIDGLVALRKLGSVPIAADESLRDASSIARLAARQAIDLAVVKPMALGGWRQTQQVAKLAADTGIGLVVTTFLDGAIGRAMATHIAAVLNPGQRAQGLGTGPLLAADLTDRPVPVRDGAVSIPEEPGLGVGTLLPEVVEQP